MMLKDTADAEYEELARLHVDALSHAVQRIPADRIRLYICRGNYDAAHL